jgi:hypothetical protein
MEVMNKSSDSSHGLERGVNEKGGDRDDEGESECF